MILPDHARRRMQPRATRLADIKAIMAHGTQVGDGFLLRKRDVAEVISGVKGEIKRLERLKNRAVISDR